MLIDYSTNLKEQFAKFRRLQRQDPKLQNIMNQIKKKPHERFIIHKDILFSIGKNNKYHAMISDTMSSQIIRETHITLGTQGHTKFTKFSGITTK